MMTSRQLNIHIKAEVWHHHVCILEVLMPQGSLGTSSKTVETGTALQVELRAPNRPQQEKLLISYLLSPTSGTPANCLSMNLEDPLISKIPWLPEHLISSFCDLRQETPLSADLPRTKSHQDYISGIKYLLLLTQAASVSGEPQSSSIHQLSHKELLL